MAAHQGALQTLPTGSFILGVGFSHEWVFLGLYDSLLLCVHVPSPHMSAGYLIPAFHTSPAPK